MRAATVEVGVRTAAGRHGILVGGTSRGRGPSRAREYVESVWMLRNPVPAVPRPARVGATRSGRGPSRAREYDESVQTPPDLLPPDPRPARSWTGTQAS